MQTFNAWVARHRAMVGLLWLAVTIVGVLLAPSVSSRLKSGVHVHGGAYPANQRSAGSTAAPPKRRAY